MQNNSNCSQLSKSTSLETLFTNVPLPWRDHLVCPFVALLEPEHLFCLTSWRSHICTHGGTEEDKLPYILPDIHHPCHSQEAQDSSLTLSSCWLLALEGEECRHLEAYKQVKKDQGLKKTSWLSVSCFWTWTMCGARPDPACSSHSLADGYWLQPNIEMALPQQHLEKCTAPTGVRHITAYTSSPSQAWELVITTHLLHLCWVLVGHAEGKLEQMLPSSSLLTPAQHLN